MTRDECVALDANDPLASFRDKFALPEGVIYLDGNSLGVLPRNVMARVKAAVEQEWGETLIKSWNEHGWFHLAQKIGARLERLTGAEPGSVIVGIRFRSISSKFLLAPLGKGGSARLICRLLGACATLCF